MEVDHTIESLAANGRPATPRARVHFIHSLEAELDSRLAITLRFPPIDVASHVPKLKVAEPILGELDVAGDFFVNEVLVSHLH